MKKYVSLFLLFLFSVCAPTSAQNPAGIALYFESGNEIYLLLADHGKRPRGWATYGGGTHQGETTAETAARETEEETRGYFARAHMLRRIEGQTPVMDGGFALFFAEVEFVPAQRVTNHQPVSEDPAFFERGPFAWIPFSEIKSHIRAPVDNNQKYSIDTRFLPPDRKTDWMWPVWLGTMRIALKTNALPWATATK